MLVIPGNPGVADFYLPFMRRLHDRLAGEASVTCTYHLGMDGQGLTSEVSLELRTKGFAHRMGGGSVLESRQTEWGGVQAGSVCWPAPGRRESGAGRRVGDREAAQHAVGVHATVGVPCLLPSRPARQPNPRHPTAPRRISRWRTRCSTRWT